MLIVAARWFLESKMLCRDANSSSGWQSLEKVMKLDAMSDET
jgi:hypothetical protein